MNILLSISSFTAQTVSFKFLQQYVHRNTQKIAHNIVLAYGRVVVVDGKGWEGYLSLLQVDFCFNKKLQWHVFFYMLTDLWSAVSSFMIYWLSITSLKE